VSTNLDSHVNINSVLTLPARRKRIRDNAWEAVWLFPNVESGRPVGILVERVESPKLLGCGGPPVGFAVKVNGARAEFWDVFFFDINCNFS
jgi:hypothetical protein